MTAAEIIDEIEQLAPREKAQVISFVRSLAPASRRSPEELTALARDLIDAPDDPAADKLKDRIAAGFYAEGDA